MGLEVSKPSRRSAVAAEAGARGERLFLACDGVGDNEWGEWSNESTPKSQNKNTKTKACGTFTATQIMPRLLFTKTSTVLYLYIS